MENMVASPENLLGHTQNFMTIIIVIIIIISVSHYCYNVLIIVV
jgi:hypothetical protein